MFVDSCKQGCRSLLSIGGIICNFTPILPYFQRWGDEPRPRFFSGEHIKWRPKREGLHQKWNTFFPNSGEDQKKTVLHQKWNTFFSRILVKFCAQMHTRVKFFWGDANVDHTQIIGSVRSICGGWRIPPIRVSGPLHAKACWSFVTVNNCFRPAAVTSTVYTLM